MMKVIVFWKSSIRGDPGSVVENEISYMVMYSKLEDSWTDGQRHDARFKDTYIVTPPTTFYFSWPSHSDIDVLNTAHTIVKLKSYVTFK